MSDDERKDLNYNVRFDWRFYAHIVLVLLATAFLGAYVAIMVTHGDGCVR